MTLVTLDLKAKTVSILSSEIWILLIFVPAVQKVPDIIFVESNWSVFPTY